MRFFDLLIMSINNLRRRKLRTGLTVLGVVIGTASIVVMVSLGIGLKENTVESYASFGSLTRIQISSGYGNQSEDDYLVDATVTKLAKIPCVPDPGDRCESEAGSLSGIFEHCGNAQRGAGTDSAGGGRTSEQECGDSGVYRRKYGFR